MVVLLFMTFSFGPVRYRLRLVVKIFAAADVGAAFDQHVLFCITASQTGSWRRVCTKTWCRLQDGGCWRSNSTSRRRRRLPTRWRTRRRRRRTEETSDGRERRQNTPQSRISSGERKLMSAFCDITATVGFECLCCHHTTGAALNTERFGRGGALSHREVRGQTPSHSSTNTHTHPLIHQWVCVKVSTLSQLSADRHV